MHKHASRFASLALALLLVVSSMGLGAAIAWDDETTNTPTTSDVTTTSTTEQYYPGNDSHALYVEVTGANTSNLTLELSPAGLDYVAYANASADETDATNGHYAWNVSHAELDDLPRDVEGGEYDVVVRNDSGDELLSQTVTFDQQAQNDKTSAIIAVIGGDSSTLSTTNLVADRLEISSKETGLFGYNVASFWSDNPDEINVSTWSGSTVVDGANTSVAVNLENSTAADSYDAAAEDLDDGEWMTTSTVFVDGIPLKVYKNEHDPEEDDSTFSFGEDDSENESYAVYDVDADSLEIHTNGEDFADSRTLSVRGGAGEGYDFGELWSNFGVTSALGSLW